jgi:hypothetical protein
MGEKEEQQPAPPPRVVVEDEDFKVLYINGVFGNVDMAEGRMIVYQIRMKAEGETEDASNTNLKVKEIEQRILLELRMPPSVFKSIGEWIMNNVAQLEAKMGEIAKREEEAPEYSPMHR